jgi:hypothetical protein
LLSIARADEIVQFFFITPIIFHLPRGGGWF